MLEEQHKEEAYQEGKTDGTDLVGGVQVADLDQAKPPGHAISAPEVQSITCSTTRTAEPCAVLLDTNVTTHWDSKGNGPSTIVVDLGSVRNLTGLIMVPPKDSANVAASYAEKHTVLVRETAQQPWTTVAYGTWWPDDSEKLSAFQPAKARYLQLALHDKTVSVAELEIYEADYIVPDPQKGAWGLTIDFPLVPVSGAVDPLTGEVLVWSSWGYKQFTGYRSGKTQTAVWNPSTQTVTRRSVSETDHDMFCSGISSDADGNVLVFGGNSAAKISLYNTTSHEWQKRADMAIERGYEASAMCSDGRIFSIGGSFSGQTRNKDGEIYDPSTDTSTMLDGAKAHDLLTMDRRQYRMDNHAWLFGWKDGYVFHGGPSKAMNWYGTKASGSTTSAGQRADQDAMCGNVVMYDAGKILAFGGSRYYETQPATNNAFILTIDEPEQPADVVVAEPMTYTRTFHTSVVLPDGTVFTHGGQDIGLPFNESYVHFTPERFVPDTSSATGGHWEQLLPNNIVRVYHSIALLLRDGTVFTGGGGLCGDCDANHFDAQIFIPPNLLNSDGSVRTDRPQITSVSPPSGKPGDIITVKTDGSVNEASIIRYGSATHTVNTDQRRIAVELTEDPDENNTYTFEIPSEPGVATPGYYMLFVLNEEGVPSVSENVQVTV
ncbi:galactose oxidase [Aspergillus floccosus]